MWIKSLQLNNFRCFEKLKINFERTYTVLIGINGAGKSSILDAMSIALGSFLAGLDGVSSNALHQDDVHYRMYEEGSVPNREKQFPTSILMDAEVNGGIAIQWQRRLNNENGRTTVKEARSIMEYASSLQERVRKGDKGVILPLIAYYGTGRLWARKQNRLKSSQSKLNSARSRLRGYKDCLDVNTNESIMLRWFSKMTYTRLQEGRAVPELEAVEQAVADCYCGMDDKAKDVKFRFSVKSDELELVIHYKDGAVSYLPVRLLSDGIRTILNMVADIAYRMAVLNTQLLGNIVRDTDGIVMIDELDMHLHPSWQQRIMQDLTRIFPKLQFVVTTHAPSILANVHKENIRIIKDNEVFPAHNNSYGRNLTAIMHELMETEIRPQEILALLKKFNDNLDEGDAAEAKKILETLEKTLGSNDQDVVDAKIALTLESI